MSKAMDNLKPLADEYAKIKAQIADLELKKKDLVKVFREAGVEALEGDLFRVVISNVEDSWGPDWKRIAAKLNPSRQLIAANQKCTKGYTRVNVYSRTGDE